MEILSQHSSFSFNQKVIMSIISILSPDKKRLLASKPLLNILHQIQSGLYQYEVKKLRGLNSSTLANTKEVQASETPWFTVAGHFSSWYPIPELVTYSKHYLLELPNVSNEEKERYRSLLMANGFVLSCFINAAGTGLCWIVVTDGQIGEHVGGFELLRSYFQEYLNVDTISDEGKSIYDYCRFSWDPALHLNWAAEPFKLFLQGYSKNSNSDKNISIKAK